MTVQLIVSFTVLGTGDISLMNFAEYFYNQSSIVLINVVTGTINNTAEVNSV